MRSFQASLALRVGSVALALFLGLGLVLVLALRSLLSIQLDATLLRIAETEAQAGAAASSSDFAFHEGVLLAGGSGVPELTRYAQLWSSDGLPLIRSRNLHTDLVLPAGALQEAREGRVAWATHRLPDGARLRSLVYPLRLVGDAHGDHVLQVAAPTAPLRATVTRFALLVAGLALTLAAASWLLGWRLAAAALRPTREITAQAAALGAGSLPARITAHADLDEFRQLVEVLNAMLDRLDAAFVSQRRFTADASHELRGPLNVLRGEIDVALKRDRSPESYREVLERCRGEVERLTRLTSDLLLLARAEAGGGPAAPEEVDLHEVAATVIERYRAPASARGIALALEGPSAVISGQGDLLERAMGNLVDNAVNYTAAPGRVVVRVSDGPEPAVEVEDSGPGITGDLASHLFDRFYRGNPARPRAEGSGLGLSIARAAAEAHGGTLEFLGNRPGAVFRMRLRRALPESPSIA